MICPHCQANIGWVSVLNELHKVLVDYQAQLAEMRCAMEEHRRPSATNTQRSDLIAWLESWRVQRGLPPANLKGRSMAQLRKMRSEASRGTGFRLGRKWKVGRK